MDVTLTTYKNLLVSLAGAGYAFQTFQDFLKAPASRAVILRHDVDERPQNGLMMARVEHGMGVQASYYFRILKISNDPAVIAEIARMGHEIGYHYEDLALAGGDLKTAIKRFSENLTYFRRFYPVQTICMHGSSMSSHDNRALWEHYDFKDFGIIGEPYFSVDYNEVFYLTDTGRRWDGGKFSVRDNVQNRFQMSFHKTSDLIRAAENGQLPDKILLQSHTLWTDSMIEWVWLEVREKSRGPIKMAIAKTPWLKNLAYKAIIAYSKSKQAKEKR
jgi:hypothetical protein